MTFDRDELLIIVNALNELLHNNDSFASDGEFQTRIGAERKEAEALLYKITGKKMEDKNE